MQKHIKNNSYFYILIQIKKEGVVLLGFVVVDDGVIADVGNGFVVFVDGSVLGVNVGQVGAVVLVDVAVPDVLVDGDVGLLFNSRCIRDN